MNTPHFDQAALERIMRIGGHKLLCQMIDAFNDTIPKHLNAIQQGIVKGDLEVITSAAHAMRSTAANLGAEYVLRIASQIERDAPTAPPGALTSQCLLLDAAVTSASQHFNELKVQISA